MPDMPDPPVDIDHEAQHTDAEPVPLTPAELYAQDPGDGGADT